MEREISETERLKTGKKRALHLLERKDYSRKELTERLKSDGYENDILTKIIEYVDSFHYLDDKRVAANFIRNRKERKSKREIEFLLRQKGISEDDILEAFRLTYVKEDGTDQEEAAIYNYLKKYNLNEDTLKNITFEEKQKYAGKLYRKGYSADKIKRVLDL